MGVWVWGAWKGVSGVVLKTVMSARGGGDERGAPGILLFLLKRNNGLVLTE